MNKCNGKPSIADYLNIINSSIVEHILQDDDYKNACAGEDGIRDELWKSGTICLTLGTTVCAYSEIISDTWSIVTSHILYCMRKSEHAHNKIAEHNLHMLYTQHLHVCCM